MVSNIVYTDTFSNSFAKLDKLVAKRVKKKVLALLDSQHNILPVSHMPKGKEDLKKIKVGDWRVFFWLDTKKQTVTLHAVWHRNEAYKKLIYS